MYIFNALSRSFVSEPPQDNRVDEVEEATEKLIVRAVNFPDKIFNPCRKREPQTDVDQLTVCINVQQKIENAVTARK